MQVFKVDFKYMETGYIPNVVAENMEAALEGAKVILKVQGIDAEVVSATSIQEQKPAEAGTLQ